MLDVETRDWLSQWVFNVRRENTENSINLKKMGSTLVLYSSTSYALNTSA